MIIKTNICVYIYIYIYIYKRAPKTPTQLLTHYFVARELYIAHSLSRNFDNDDNNNDDNKYYRIKCAIVCCY